MPESGTDTLSRVEVEPQKTIPQESINDVAIKVKTLVSSFGSRSIPINPANNPNYGYTNGDPEHPDHLFVAYDRTSPTEKITVQLQSGKKEDSGGQRYAQIQIDTNSDGLDFTFETGEFQHQPNGKRQFYPDPKDTLDTTQNQEIFLGLQMLVNKSYAEQYPQRGYDVGTLIQKAKKVFRRHPQKKGRHV